MTVSAVNFGTIPATSFTVNSATQITAVAPAGTGTVNVRVVTTQGTSATAAVNQFTYTAVPVPTITNLNPNNGPAAGGTSVVITGTNLTGATQVRFGATNATSYTVNSATQITAVSPAGSGAQNVTVTTPEGTSGALTFTYAGALVAPVITSSNAVNATEGTAFSYTITASGNPAPAIATGFNATGLPTSPAWLTRTNNVVSGTPPPASGNTSVTFTVTATNSEGTSPGVLVTVTIAEPSVGWSIEWSFPNTVNILGPAGHIQLASIPGWNPAWAADLNETTMYDNLDPPSAFTMADLPVHLYVQYPADTATNTWVGPIHFDNWGPGALGVPNTIANWGLDEPNGRIMLTGGNATGGPLRLKLEKA